VATFVLVHGAWHGAWCWSRLVRELEARGHRAVAIDLPSDEPAAGFDEYVASIARAAEGEPDVVLVGHSLAGLTIPLVAAARPVRRLVYLCALLPEPGRSLVDQLSVEPEIFVEGFGRGIARDDRDRSYWASREAAVGSLFADCSSADADWAFARLRPQGRRPNIDPCTLDRLPDVESTYVLGRDDACIRPEWSRRAARERLGVEPVELAGGHSPFLARPDALAGVLVR
jgi:pimeloyl-ACP methyl ester carboxylesterase